MTEFNPMDEPTQCPFCRDHPDWLEIWEGGYQCQNCLAIIDSKGNVIEEPEPDDEVEEDLYDE